MLLIRIQLRINETRNVVLIISTQILHGAYVFSGTGTNVRTSGKRAIVASTFAEPVEPFRAVGLRAGPFADDGPFVGAGEVGAEGAGGGDVGGGGHGDLAGAEDLVLVGVEDDVLVAGGGVEFAVPVGLDIFEGVVDGGCEIGACALDGLVAGLVVAEDFVEVEVRPERLVQEFDGGYDVCVAGVALREVFDCGNGL